MIIPGFRIQNILETYYKYIRWAEKKARGSADRSRERERVAFSVEGRKKQICQKAANQVIERLTKAKDTTGSFPGESQ